MLVNVELKITSEDGSIQYLHENKLLETTTYFQPISDDTLVNIEELVIKSKWIDMASAKKMKSFLKEK